MKKSPSTIFQHDCVNDLFFAIFSPELLSHPQSLTIELTPLRLEWLQQQDINPEALLAATNTEQRLGHYYENLWAFFLNNDNQFELIAQNLVVRSETKTIGEFDFIFLDRTTEQHIHLEVAIKFYLFFRADVAQASSELDYWIGPNSQDSLKKKYRHLTEKQSKLHNNKYAKDKLNLLGITDLNKSISLKGYLFSQDIQLQPHHFNTGNTIAAYHYFDDIKENVNTENLYILQKKNWISNSHQELELFDLKRIEQLLNKRQSPILLAYCHKEQGVLLEQRRFFICPRSWPYCLIKPYKSLNNSM